MSPGPSTTLGDPQQTIAELQQQLAERTVERDEALARETSTAEILTVISNLLTDTQPVFEAIVQSGLKLFPDAAISIALAIEDQIHAVAIAEPDRAHAD